MTRNKPWTILFFILVIGLLFASPVAAEARDIVVGNTKEWQSLYLATMYAGLTDSKIIFFENLGDSQIKSRTIGKNDNIVIFESNKNPVVKNYESFLRVNGYKSFETIKFDNFEDLQEFIYDDIDTEGSFITTSEFGIDAVVATPLIVKGKYKPIFITENNIEYVKKNARPSKTIISGHIPVRWIKNMDGEKIIGYPHETNPQLMDFVTLNYESEWGTILKIDTVDLESIKQGIPTFVYYGSDYLDVVADSIKSTGIKNFEVIGSGTSDIAKSLEAGAGEDLKMLLKYGRTVTNVPGLEGKILDVDSVTFNSPIEFISVQEAKYYPNLGVFGVTFKNEGNVDVMLFTNAEYASSAVSDDYPHHILVGQTKTIPFAMTEIGEESDAILTTRYGYSFPLRRGIIADDGNPIFRTTVETDSHSENPVLEFRSSSFDHKEGILKIRYFNSGSNDVNVYSELQISDELVLSSEIDVIEAGKERTVAIRTPHVESSLLSEQTIPIVTYFGEKDTLSSVSGEVFIEKQRFGLTGLVASLGGGVTVVASISALVILGLIIFFIFRKKRR